MEHETYALSAAAAVEAFAEEMRSAGPFRVTMSKEETYTFYALFDRDGTITAGIDPARPVGSDEWVDTIAPLHNIEEI